MWYLAQENMSNQFNEYVLVQNTQEGTGFILKKNSASALVKILEQLNQVV